MTSWFKIDFAELLVSSLRKGIDRKNTGRNFQKGFSFVEKHHDRTKPEFQGKSYYSSQISLPYKEIDESSARSSDEPRRAVFPDTESIVDWYALQPTLQIPMTYSDLKDEYQKLLTNYQNLLDQCRVQEFKAVQALERQVASMSTQLGEMAERHQAEHTRQEEFL